MSAQNGLPPGYTLIVVGDVYAIEYRADAILQFERLTDHRDGLSAEVTAIHRATGAQHWSRLNLAAPRSRAELSRRLEESLPGVPWAAILDVSNHAIVTAYRVGTPAVELQGDPPARESRWLIEGLIPMGTSTVLYGDGGKGKSLSAIALALSSLRGGDLGGSPRWRTRPLGAILFCDWEDDEDSVWRTLRALCRADGIVIPPGFHYMRMTRPIADAVPQITRDVAAHQIEAVVLDSWVPACGLLPEGADASSRAMAAVRVIDRTALIVAHVTKASAESDSPARPYGSIFNWNLARSAIELTSSQEANALTVTFTHRKANRGPLAPSRALCYTFSGTESEPEIAVESAQPDLTRTSLTAQIKAALGAGKKDGHAIAQELGASPESVTRILRRDEGRTFARIDGGRIGGRGVKVLWGLIEKGGRTPC